MKHPRTIFLQQNTASRWFVRTGSSNGQKISTEEDHPRLQQAIRAFVTEGRHQPFATMVVICEGQKPMTIRAGSGLPEPSREAEDMQEARIKAALAYRKPTRSTQ